MFANISMFYSEPQPSADAAGRHLLLFDGVCGLCSRLVQFVLVRDRRRIFDFASLQSPIGRAVVERPEDLSTFYAFADYRAQEARRLTKARAALFVMCALGWPWKVAGLFGVLPTALLDRLYDLVARNRYRAFGRSEHCLMPLPEYRTRFVD
jgi:predicted DCC family thiol-disulfide oxidoreductase YuxK